jgi:hypothetical protein
VLANFDVRRWPSAFRRPNSINHGLTGRQFQPEPLRSGHLAVVRRRLAPGLVNQPLRRNRHRGSPSGCVSRTFGPVIADVNFAALEWQEVADACHMEPTRH